MGDLVGKVAVITGASSGIGEATAIALANAGAAVVLGARRLERLEAIKNKIQGDCLTIEVDVTRKDQVKYLIQKTKDVYGQVDILVNNAGVMFLSELEKLRVEEWEKMIDVNVKGVLYGLAEVIPVMKAQSSGHVINIASIAGHRVKPASAVYSATKYAVRAITEGFRLELSNKSGIRISLISPGVVDTELTNHITDADIKEMAIKQKESLTPLHSKDIANTIVNIVSQPAHMNINESIIMPTEQP